MEHRIVLRDSNFKGLYNWALQEVDKDGNENGLPLIPWNWRISFEVCEIKIFNSINGINPKRSTADLAIDLERTMIDGGNNAFDLMIEEQQRIEFKLKVREPKELYFIGSNSVIKEIDMAFFQDAKQCSFHGRPSTGLYIEWGSSRKDYLKILDFANSGFKKIYVTCEGVMGAYAPWVPGIHTDYVKFLSRSDEQHVEQEININEFPILGSCRSLDISAVRKIQLDENQEGNIAENCDNAQTHDYYKLGNSSVDQHLEKAMRMSEGNADLKFAPFAGKELQRIRIALWILIIIICVGIFL